MSEATRTTDRQVLLADIGGTHARFLLAKGEFDVSGRIDLFAKNFDTFEDAIATALDAYELERPAGIDAVFAVAGPVTGERVRFTNLPWLADAKALQAAFGFRSVRLVNDVAAAATALAREPSTNVVLLQPGKTEAGRNALLSVGTGLGVAYWSYCGNRLHVDSSEAGHAAFGPGNAWQTEWLQYLQKRHGERVSWEHVLSGAGLAALDAWLRDVDDEEPRNVVQHAHEGSAAAHRAIRKYCNMLGACAGDLALAAPALEGVWLAGGVLAGLDKLFDETAFLAGFHDKGGMSGLMKGIPVYCSHDNALGLCGAWFTALEGLDARPPGGSSRNRGKSNSGDIFPGGPQA